MSKFEDHEFVISAIEKAQSADKDEREQSRDDRLFLDKPDGQWEPEVYNAYKSAKRPRYTLDKCNPIVNQIAGEIKKADFDIKIRPNGGDASKEKAKLMDGLIRNIENLSNASKIYSHAAKNMVGSGIDGWMITQDWADTETFDQDLFIKPISSFVDSVWFDPNSMERDRSDAVWAVKLTALSKSAYEEKWPDGSGKSLSENRASDAYWDKPEQVIVGEFYWIEEKPVEIIQMNNGAVYREDEIALIVDELAAAGITEKSRRTRPERICKVRHLDGGDWLDDEQETVFNWIPIIPIYANFNIIENKIVWRSAIEKLKDAQRIYNYARSRQIEEGALTPRDKTWMTREQAEGNEKQLRTMNTNSDPIQFYNHVEGQVQPYRPGASMPNPSLEGTANAAMNDIVQGSGLFSASMGDNPGLQSGIAIEQLQERGDTGTLDYFEALEVAISHTARIIVDALPKVYDTQRQVRVLSEDGTFSMETLNQVVIDNQTGQPVVLNDLSKGRYEVSCSVGKSFKSRQQEAVASILEIANIDPSVITEGGDVLLNSMSAPGLDLIAERKRQQLFNAGVIPQGQLTQEEQQQIAQAQQQPQQPDASTILAQAEMMKAQADMAEAQLKQQDQQIRMAELQQKAQLAQSDQQLKAASLQQTGQKDAISASQKQQEFDLKIEQMQQDLALKLEDNDRKNAETMREMQLSQQELVRMQAETLKTLREAMGADAIVNPSTVTAYNKQSDEML